MILGLVMRMVIVYRDRDGDWRWRLKSHNGKVLADSAEGYRSKRHCVKMVESIFIPAGFQDPVWHDDSDGRTLVLS